MVENSEKKLKPMLRKVLVIGNSHYLSIPKSFVKHYGFKAGDSVSVVAATGILKIIPMQGDR